MSKLYDETVDQLAAALYSLLAVELMEWSDVDEPTKQWWRKAVRKIIDAVPGIAVVDIKGLFVFTPEEAHHIKRALQKHYGDNDEWCSVCDSIVGKLEGTDE